MHRFFIPPEECHNNPLRLSPTESKHARSVLRLREGDRVVVLNGAGKELLCQASEARNDSTTLEIIQENSIPPLPFEITLYQAVAKGKAMDFIVQKATELGAHRVVPVLSERSVPDWDDAKTAAKVEKWRSICIESIKQCGSAWLPRLELPMTPKAALDDARQSDLSLIACTPTQNTPANKSTPTPSSTAKRRANWRSGSGRKATTRRRKSTPSAQVPSRSRLARLCSAAKPPPSTASPCSTTNCRHANKRLVYAEASLM